MGEGVTRRGQPYVVSVATNQRFPTESPRLILRPVDVVACPNGLQSLAMVLFHAHTVQLPGDDSHHHCTALMAVALVGRTYR